MTFIAKIDRFMSLKIDSFIFKISCSRLIAERASERANEWTVEKQLPVWHKNL